MGEFGRFRQRLETLQREYDRSIGRILKPDTFGHWVRLGSRYLTYVFYRLGLKGPHILAAHGLTDLVGLYFVATMQPLKATAFFMLSHVLDNCDGDLARARGEADPKWLEIDHIIHLIAGVVFWSILALAYRYEGFVVLILAFQIVLFHFQVREGDQKWFQKSRFWAFVNSPKDPTIRFLAWGIFAVAGYIELFLAFYVVYYYAAAVTRLGKSLERICIK